MSVSTWDTFGGFPSGVNRQRQRRRGNSFSTGSYRPSSITTKAGGPESFASNRNNGGKKKWNLPVLGLTIVSIAVLHAGVATLWQSTPALAPVPKKEIIVEMVKPKEPEKIEPPKPLPQKLAPPPKAAPRPVAKPAPAPAPAPRKAEPIADNAPKPELALPPAPPAPPVQKVEPVQEKVTQPIGYAGYLHNPPPVYPSNAERMGIEGKVVLKVHVLANGKPDTIEIQNSSGKKMLDEAAIAAVRGWMFTPSHRGQTPIDGWATVPIQFKLERS
jgi:protein TonB